MKLLAYTLFAAVVVVATARVILGRARTCYGWTHDELDAAQTAARAQWRCNEAK